MKNVKGKYLKDIPFINQLRSQNRIISIMKEMLFSPGEYIFRQDEANDCSLFYLVKGEVEIVQENSQKKQEGQILVKRLQKLSYFGEISFITGGSRSAAARAIDFCIVYKLERLKFIEIIQECNDDYETFCMIKEAILFKKSYNLIKTSCFSCGDSSHLIQECSKIHFTVITQLLASKTFRSTPILQRLSIQRKSKKYKALNNIDYCINDAYKILNDQVFSESLESSFLDELTIEQLQLIKNTQKQSTLNSKKFQNIFDDRKISINISDGLVHSNPEQQQQQDEHNAYEQNSGSQNGIHQTDKDNQIKQKKFFSSNNLEFSAIPEENLESVFKSSQNIQNQRQTDQMINDQSEISELSKVFVAPNKVFNTEEIILFDVSQINEGKLQATQKQANLRQLPKNINGNSHDREGIKRRTYYKDDLHNKKTIKSEDLIPSCELIQPIYVENTNATSIKNFRTSTIDYSDYVDTSDTEANNLKIKAQRYFQQIKCQNLGQKQQKCSLSQFQATSNSQKKLLLAEQCIQIQSQLNILDEYNKQTNQILENSEKSSNQENIRKQLFEQQVSKFPTIDQQKNKRSDRRKSTLTQQENIFQSFYPNQKNIEQLLLVHSQILEKKDISDNKEEKPRIYQPEFIELKQSKIIDFIQKFDWEYLEMHLFDKIKNFQYYYPTFNFTNIIKKIKQQKQPRRSMNSKKIRACLINGQRRKPIFDKYGSCHPKIQNKN